MGKSPGKWIKTLFGKRSSKTQVLKAHTHDKERNGKKGSGLESPVISHPIPVIDSGNANTSEIEVQALAAFPGDGMELTIANEGVQKQPDGASDSMKDKLEKAAVKTQAAFRGYLARRAFRALRGIIRLQAVMRGHLVRRQAVATFQCILSIVKFQALARGCQVRRLNGDDKFCQAVSSAAKLLDSPTFAISSLKMKFKDHIFIFKLLSGTPTAMPLRLQYVDGEPNSMWIWLERWTISHFWKPLPRTKKAVGLKAHGKHSSFTIETEAGRPKRSVRRNFSNIEHLNTNSIVESEKAKRSQRKSPISQIAANQESPQNELEKVKRSLRKVTNSTSVTSDQTHEETEKQKHGMRRVSKSPIEEKEKIEKEFVPLSSGMEVKPSPENGLKSEQGIEPAVVVDPKPIDACNHSDDHNVVPDTLPLQRIILDENQSPLNKDLVLTDVHSNESQKTNRRRASFSSKPDYPENNQLDTPKIPSYMASTESAKAKLQGRISPRFSSDAVDKVGVTRRHSLPSAINGKLVSQSPRVQKITPTSGGKGGTKGDRSNSSSRDDKPNQAEWKR